MRSISYSIPVGLCLAATFFLALPVYSRKQKDLQIITQHKPDECYEVADIGDEVFVHYTGKLESGAIFDSSRQGGRGPLPFKLGEGRVIPGWEQGIRGMCVGEQRQLIIPPHLAYGANGHPPTIPPEATLTFDTELVNINKKSIEIDIIGMLQFLAMPLLVCLILYYLYDKYRKEQTKQKESKNTKSERDRRPRKKKN